MITRVKCLRTLKQPSGVLFGRVTPLSEGGGYTLGTFSSLSLMPLGQKAKNISQIGSSPQVRVKTKYMQQPASDKTLFSFQLFVFIPHRPYIKKIPPMWVFSKIGENPQNGLFRMNNPMNKWMIWGENPPIFGSTSHVSSTTMFSFPGGNLKVYRFHRLFLRIGKIQLQKTLRFRAPEPSAGKRFEGSKKCERQ